MPESKEILKKYINYSEIISKGHRSPQDELPMFKDGTIWTTKSLDWINPIVLDSNLKYKINFYQCINTWLNK